MTCKHFLSLCSALATIVVSAQTKEFSFTGYQTSNQQQQWNGLQCVDLRKARFHENRIELTVDRNYRLSVVNKTHLPNKGVVYLCRDQMQRDVTVTLIGSERMFLYADGKRYQISFNAPVIAKSREIYADAD